MRKKRTEDTENLGIETLVREILTRIGEDPARQGLAETPERISRALAFLTRGYRQRLEEVVKNAVFKQKCDEMVIVKDINFYSLCEHHLLPFFGHAHIAYLPDGRLIGLSKIPRIVDMFARRLQLQERMTVQIAESIQKILRPKGVGVVIEAEHMCITMRGVEKQHSRAVTSAMLGSFRDKTRTRAEFLALIGMSMGARPS
ncbi:GTP cyclohydrolase [candidate division BRC1 bacterium SM23_51]|nr:MAG: GTP cyclohydrolase [candidate division BRC1 bacterium SM23_51]